MVFRINRDDIVRMGNQIDHGPVKTPSVFSESGLVEEAQEDVVAEEEQKDKGYSIQDGVTVVSKSGAVLPDRGPSLVNQEQFTILGQQDSLDANGFPLTTKEELAYAKYTCNSDGQYRFYVREANSGDPLNPLEPEHETPAHRMTKSVRYKSVSKATFDTYLQFLVSKNVAHYKAVLTSFY